MYISPNHPDRQRLLARAAGRVDGATPPDGRILYEHERGRAENLTKLVVSIEEYNGYPYIKLAIWHRNQSGVWWPVRDKCISIRSAELAAVAEALGSVDLGQLRRDHPPANDQADDRPVYREPRGRRHERFDPAGLPPAPSTDNPEFSEVDE